MGSGVSQVDFSPRQPRFEWITSIAPSSLSLSPSLPPKGFWKRRRRRREQNRHTQGKKEEGREGVLKPPHEPRGRDRVSKTEEETATLGAKDVDEGGVGWRRGFSFVIRGRRLERERVIAMSKWEGNGAGGRIEPGREGLRLLDASSTPSHHVTL